MSNMSKTIAILGVVAGLGVAALPLSTYAADTTVEWGPKADNEASWTAGTMGGTSETAIGNDSFVSTDTAIKLNITDKLSITSNAANVELTTEKGNAANGIWSADAMRVTVVTRNAGGYKLTIAGIATGANPTSLTNGTGEQIVAGDLTGTVSQWGYKYGAATFTAGDPGSWTDAALTATDNTGWVAVKPAATADTILSNTKPTSDNGEAVTVKFGAHIVDGQAAGEYNGKVTFTATNVAKVAEP